jgi:hypothetical protein
MKDTLTESVARLYRAGSEHSQQTEKLRKAVDNLLEWMRTYLPPDYKLPFHCRLYSSGDFTYEVCRGGEGSVRQDFRLTKGKAHSVRDLNLFSMLIADGFIDKISEDLEKQTSVFSATTSKIEVAIK